VETMTPQQKLRELALAATPGEWKTGVWIETDGNEWRATGPGHEEHVHDHGAEPGCPDEQAAQRDAAFIAAACPNTVIGLLDELEELRTHDRLNERDVWLAGELLRQRIDRLERQLAAMTAARDEACDLLQDTGIYPTKWNERAAALRRVGGGE
jgi:hypothetical protein